ncbi:intraflagellar transport protein 43 homolog [Atheta coriaria]|uniref:intraflagellar transport protein 43 homolog n=1 Tax=Dalotia coriaria TaxID=877792 RepID=UPI0031F3D131
MNWDDDIDTLAQKKSAAKQGRRAGMTQSPDRPETQDLSLDSDPGSPGPTLLKAHKTGRWADEGSKSARKSSINLIEQERFEGQVSRRDDSDDDIPIIPDIDDMQEEMLSLHDTSKKPSISVNKATYKELGSEVSNLQKKIANIGNINLSFLTTQLYPEDDIKDLDEPWTMDDLFETLLTCNK